MVQILVIRENVRQIRNKITQKTQAKERKKKKKVLTILRLLRLFSSSFGASSSHVQKSYF